MEERLQSHYALLSRTIEFTRTADAKAMPVIFLNLAFIGAVSTRLSFLVEVLKGFAGCFECLAMTVLILYWLVATASALIFAAFVYIPKNPSAGGSLLYFEDIAAMDKDGFIDKSKNLKQESLEKELLTQIHIVSGIASTKMCRVKWAFYVSIVSTVLTLLILILAGTIGTDSFG